MNEVSTRPPYRVSLNGVMKMSTKVEGQLAATEGEGTTNLEVETGTANDETTGQVAEGEGQGTGEAAEQDVVVTIGEEAPPAEEEEHAQAPEWVRELRKSHRELQRKNRELEDKLKTGTAETKPAVTLGPKPKLEDHDYDAEKYEAALESWYKQKRQVDEQAAKAEAEAKSANEAWQAKLTSYGKAKTELKVKDFDDAEATVQETLSSTQQGIILQGAENPALLVYALGKNPKKAKELASITDPVKYAFAVAKLETQLKVTNRKAAPPPEKTVRGTGSVSGTVDSQLERLRADAEKTGDYSKVIAYKRSKRQS
jgi:hypothetical protein